MNVYESKTFSETYLKLLKDLMTSGNIKSPRGLDVKYFQNCLFTVDEPGDVFSCPTREYNWDYLNKELNLYFTGECSADKFSEASKFWKRLQNPDGTVNSNYGHLVFYKEIQTKFGNIKNQWTFAKKQLLNDKDSRQALIFISSPHVQFEGNKDFICTLNYTFNINDNILSMTVNRRSQDVILGVVYDYVFEYLLLLKMYNELKPVYQDLKLGSYTMFVNNVHAYKDKWNLIENMIEDYSKNNFKQLQIIDNIDKNLIDNYVLNVDFQ